MNNIDLYNNDCIAIMKKLPKNAYDLILTDPPYNLANFMRKRATNLKLMRENFFGSAGWDDLSFADWTLHMDDFFRLSADLIKVGGSMLIFMSIIKVETIIQIAEKYGFYYKTTGIWHKKNPMPRNMNLHFVNSTEAWVYFIYKKRTGTFNNSGKSIHDFIETSVTSKSEKKYGSHPTQKPESLVSHFVRILTNEGAKVLDPFMGSGTTGVVCKRLNRSFTGIELDENYFNSALNRIASTNTKFEYNNSNSKEVIV